LTGALFEGADLREVSFMGADLQDAQFLGADLTGASFGGADLRGAVYNQGTKWPDGFDPLDYGALPVEWLPSEPKKTQ
jgi:uncharacterized protein YjbI with pentapeptide repeats